MNGIPGLLYKDLRAVLLVCGPFGDQDRESLEALFDDERLRPWRYGVPGGQNKLARVESLISFLYNKPYDKPNPLLRFIRVLGERSLEPGCQRQLQHVATQLAALFGEPDLAHRLPEIDAGEDAESREAKMALLDALIDAFPTVRELDRMVAMRMSLNLHTIAGTGNLQQVTFDLIRWADTQDRLPELWQAARSQNPSNRALADLAQFFDSP